MTRTEQFCEQIDAAYERGDKEGAVLREARKLAEMKVKSMTIGFAPTDQDEIIENCLFAIHTAKFKGQNRDGKPATYSAFVSSIIYYTTCKAVTNRKLILRKRVVLDRNRLSESEWKLAFEVNNLRNNGMTYKKIVQKLRASGELPRKTDHIALRQRYLRWKAKATLSVELVEIRRGRVMAGWDPILTESEWGDPPVLAQGNRRFTLSELDEGKE